MLADTNSTAGDESPKVGVAQHAPPARAPISARETGAPARRDPTAPGKRREAPAKREREAISPDKFDDVKARLSKPTDDDANEAKADDDESPAAEALEEAVEAATEGEGEEAKPEEPAEDYKAKAEEAQKFADEVKTKAQEVLRENQRLERKVQWLEEAIAAAGMEIDPQALELFDLRTEKDLGARVAEEQSKAKQEADAKAAKAEVERIKGEVSKAAKAANLDPKALTKRYAFALQSHYADGGTQDNEPTLADVVEELRVIADAKQKKASNSAPPPIKARGGSTSAATPRFTNDFDGWRRHLKSRGHGSAD